MQPEVRRLVLAEIHLRHRAIIDALPPGTRMSAELASELEHGPLLSVKNWFGGKGGAAQMKRLARVVRTLAKKGLIVLRREGSARWPNVRLTIDGERALADVAGKNFPLDCPRS